MIEKFNIIDKVFKIVADQAANVKCAFKNSTSSDSRAKTSAEKSETDPLEFVTKLANNMLLKQRKEELVTQKENILTKQLIRVIHF